MYVSYYSLLAKPFQITTDPRFLWLGNDHKEALANLRYGLLDGNGYVVLIGAIGTGKTTIVNALLEMLDDRVIVANINHPSLDTTEFLGFAARTYDRSAVISCKADCLHFFNAFLQHAHSNGKRVLLVIDEAHRLSEELLEEIRLLSNMERNGQKLITIFFVGQTELKRRLLSHRCRALRQRITLFYHLQPLSEAETMHYIVHRLHVAGSEARIFTSKAVQAIHKFSRGTPRLINKLCDRALLTGYVKEQTLINARIIHECVREISIIDPIMPVAPAVQRLLHVSRRWVDASWLRLALSQLISKHATALKWMRNAGAAFAAGIAMAVKRQSHEIGGAAAAVYQKKRGWATATATSVVALVVAVWMISVHWNPVAKTEARSVANPILNEEEPSILAKFSSPPPEHPDAGRHSTQASDHAAASRKPVAVLSAQLPVVAPAQSASFVTEKAVALMARNDFAAAIALIEADRGRTPANGNQVGTLYAKALTGRAAQRMSQSPEQAEGLLRKALAEDPLSVEALVQLGNCYTRTKKYAQAIEVYQQAAQLNPRLPDVFFNLGFIFATTGMYASAEEMLVRVVALKPDYLDKALFNLAVVQQKNGKHRESLASLEAAVVIRPENQDAQAFLRERKALEQEER
jgi:type II secretory pathway predicted ATPase ExeA/tetratricopeptide (TPR) repeat protein